MVSSVGGGDAGLAGALAQGGEDLRAVLPVGGDDIVEGFNPLGDLGGMVGLDGGLVGRYEIGGHVVCVP